MRKTAVLTLPLALGILPQTLPANPGDPTSARLISPAPNCATARVAQSDSPRIVRRLGDLPAAQAYHTVYRMGADGCIDPLLVSERLRGTRRR